MNTLLDENRGSPLFIAEGRRVRIRRLERQDIDDRHAWPSFEDPLYAYLNPRNLTAGERDDILKRRMAMRDWRWFTLLDQDGVMIGELALREIDERKRTARLGIHLRADRIGQGYGTDAIAAFLDYFFAVLRFRTLTLEVAENNRRAIRVYEKCGFRVMGRHLSLDRSGLDIFGNPELESLRPYFEQRRGKVYAKFLEMAVNRYQYLGRKSPGA